MLISDWKKIVKKAWSFRLMAIAGVLTGIETLLPYFADDLPRGVFSIATMLAITGAMVARLVAQQEFKSG